VAAIGIGFVQSGRSQLRPFEVICLYEGLPTEMVTGRAARPLCTHSRSFIGREADPESRRSANAPKAVIHMRSGNAHKQLECSR